MDLARVRAANLAFLSHLGFRPATSLPILRGVKQLRPVTEIASRLMALDAVVTWVCYTPEDVEDGRVKSYAARNGLPVWMTESEREIFRLPRPEARETHIDAIGWRLENMWPLAWVLGFQPEPPVDGGMIEWETVTRPMVHDFMAGLEKTVEDQVQRSRPRSLEQIAELEDRFYCAHNAVRSAQLGSTNTVPAGFHPVADGGVVHERRHALTWCISPGVAWDETDLST